MHQATRQAAPQIAHPVALFRQRIIPSLIPVSDEAGNMEKVFLSLSDTSLLQLERNMAPTRILSAATIASAISLYYLLPNAQRNHLHHLWRRAWINYRLINSLNRLWYETWVEYCLLRWHILNSRPYLFTRRLFYRSCLLWRRTFYRPYLAPLHHEDDENVILGEYIVLLHRGCVLDEHKKTLRSEVDLDSMISSVMPGRQDSGDVYVAMLDDNTLELVRADVAVRFVECNFVVKFDWCEEPVSEASSSSDGDGDDGNDSDCQSCVEEGVMFEDGDSGP